MLPQPLLRVFREERRPGGAACLQQLTLFYFLQHRCTRGNSSTGQFFLLAAAFCCRTAQSGDTGLQVLVNRRGGDIEEDEVKGGGKAKTDEQEEQEWQEPALHRAQQLFLLPVARLFPLRCRFFLRCCGHWHRGSRECRQVLRCWPFSLVGRKALFVPAQNVSGQPSQAGHYLFVTPVGKNFQRADCGCRQLLRHPAAVIEAVGSTYDIPHLS